LCGFYYFFKTHEQYRQKAGDDFCAFFDNSFYSSKNGSINKYSLFDEPKAFKDIKQEHGYSPAIHRSSHFLRVTPKELSGFIVKALADNKMVIVQKPDTLIGGKYSIKYVIEVKNSVYPHTTELCFEKESFYPLYYKTHLGKMNSQCITATFSNTKVDLQLPANYFTEENLFGRKLGRNTKGIKYKQLEIGKVVPDWELPILGKMIKLSSKELLGKYTLLEFTGTWCPHCWDAVKMMNRLENEFEGNNKLSILSVFSTDIDNEEKITKFAKEQKIKSPILYSAKTVGDEFYVNGYPTFFIIDPAGKLLLTIAGYSQDIENEIVNYLRKNIK
jgi:thiol-disulfide isomerase/thioredoxin